MKVSNPLDDPSNKTFMNFMFFMVKNPSAGPSGRSLKNLRAFHGATPFCIASAPQLASGASLTGGCALAIEPDFGGAFHAGEHVVDGLAAQTDQFGTDDTRHEIGWHVEDFL